MAKKSRWVLVIGFGIMVVLIVAVYLTLSSYDFNHLKPKIAKAALDATGRVLTIEGDIDLEIGFIPSVTLSDIKFQNAPWGSRPELAKIKRVEIQVALVPLLFKNIEIRRFILVEPDILIETSRSGKPNLVFEKQKIPSPRKEEKKKSPRDIKALPALIFKELEIEKGRLAYRDGKSGRTYEVMLDRLFANAASMDSPIELSLKGNFNREPFEVNGKLGPLIALVNPKKTWPLELNAKAVGTIVNIKGRIKDAFTPRGMDLGFNIKAQSLTKLTRLVGKPLPFNQPLEIVGHAVDTGPNTYKISELKVILGQSDLGGTIEIALAKKPVHITARLSSNKLDLKKIMGQRKETSKAEIRSDQWVKKRKRLFPDDPLPLDALYQAEGTVKIRAAQILLPNLVINDLAANLILKDGQIIVKPIKATIGGGKLDGNIDLRHKGKALIMSTQIKAGGISLESMLNELNITDMLEGHLDVDIRLKGQGQSVAKLMAGLDGYTSIIMGKGRIKNRYIDLLGTDLSASIFRLLNPFKEGDDYTAINCMVSRFDIKKGLAKSTALVFDTSLMSVIGEGKIDLKTEKLDLSFKPIPKEGIGSSGLGKLSLSLGELAKPFKLGGTLAEPSLALDPTQAAITLGKAIGGAVLFGPAGIAAALIGSSSVDKNPCLTAIEAARKGSKAPKKSEYEEKGDGGKKATKDVEEAIESIGSTLKRLFGQ